jgi:hypothetical protein
MFNSLRVAAAVVAIVGFFAVVFVRLFVLVWLFSNEDISYRAMRSIRSVAL